MQARKEAEQPARQRSYFLSRHAIMLLTILVVGVTLLSSDLALTRWWPAPSLTATPVERKTTAINGADHWHGDGRVTAPIFDFSISGTQSVQVSPLFKRYYSSHSGSASLGAPLTAAFPTEVGWIQFFGSGALLLPTMQQTLASYKDQALGEMIKAGVKDADSGIIRLPLLQALLTVGSQVPVGGDGSPLTYVDLRQATNPELMVTAPPPDHSTSMAVEVDRESVPRTLTAPTATPTVTPTAATTYQEDDRGPIRVLKTVTPPAVAPTVAPTAAPTVTPTAATTYQEDDRGPLFKRATPPAPQFTATATTATASPAIDRVVFIQTGTRAEQTVGHLIPQSIWNYINRADVSPDGWQTDFGTPLTEPLSFAFTKQGSTHQLLVQAFLYDGVILDQSNPGAGRSGIQRLDTGLAYLRTFGPPTVVLDTQKTTWTLGETALVDGPSMTHALAHVEQNFPLTLLGETTWQKGKLWYHVGWTVPNQAGAGWVPADAVTFTSPGPVPSWASFDVLSPSLQAYLVSQGNNAAAVVYDVTRQSYYTYHARSQFIVASSMKVPIMLTFLDMVEQQGREPNDDELGLLTTMIENSDNDAASALYYNEIGGAAGVANYLHKIGVTGLIPDPDAWGYSLITPLTMVNLLTMLYQGQILTPPDRQLALNLMEHVETDQRTGVGDTAPTGAIVAMKNGWVPGPDDLWVMNTSGIVKVGQQTYIISVYTQGLPSLDDGHAIVQHVCGAVASLLT